LPAVAYVGKIGNRQIYAVEVKLLIADTRCYHSFRISYSGGMKK